MTIFCKHSYHRKCKRRGVGGQKKPKFCERSLCTAPYERTSKGQTKSSMTKRDMIFIAHTEIHCMYKIQLIRSDLTFH
jgi:hypothetical protein